MKERILLLLLVSLFLLPFSARSTHIVGADLSYRCLNATTNLYEVTLTAYRDCAPGNAAWDNNITLFVFASNTGGIYLTRVINTPATTPQIVPANWTACSNQPYTLCVEQATYVTTVTLPPRTGGYDIGWARCCRNNTVTNISTGQGITVTSHVPGSNQASGCNSQPVFNRLAPQFLCAGQPFSFDHSATDADGDSLVYAICNPYSGVNTTGQGATNFRPIVSNAGFNPNRMGPPPYANLNYLTPTYSFTNPFGSGNFSIDPQSGRLTLTPTQVGQFVFAICVREYRNGVLLSEQKRDFQINVINCVNQGQPPLPSNSASTIPGISNDTVYIQPLDSVCYDVTLTGAQSTDSVELFAVSAPFGIGGSWPQPLATLTFSTPNPNVGQVQGRVCWNTACLNAGDTARLIVGGNNVSNCFGLNLSFDTIVVVVGGASPPVLQHVLPGGGTGPNIIVNPQQTFRYSFLARDRDPDSLRIIPISGPFSGPNPVVLVDTGTNPVAGTITWTPTCADAGQTFRIVIAARDTNTCRIQTTVYDTVNVIVRPLPTVNIAPIDPILCIGSSQPLSTTVTGVGVSYAWAPGSTLSDSSIANPVATPTTTTTYTLTATDIYGCVQTRSTTVNVVPLPVVTITNDTFNCPGDSLPLLATGGTGYSWTPSLGLNDPNIANPLAAPRDTTVYTVVVTDSNGCQSTDSVRVRTMNIAVNPNRVICQRDTTTLFATGGVSYSWSPALGLDDSSSRTPLAFPLATTDYVVTIVDVNGCIDRDTVRVDVLPLPPITTHPDTAICTGDTFTLSAFSPAAGTYAWTPAAGLSNASLGSPLAYPTATTTYTLVVTGTNGCIDSQSVAIQVNALPPVSAGQDTTNCEHQGVPIQATGAATYTWSPALGLSDPSIANPIANPLVSTTYTVVGVDTNGCFNSDQVNVTVFNGSVITDQVICRFDSVALPALGGSAFRWHPATGLSDSTAAAPKASPAVTTQYIVDIFHPSGCYDPDTVTVIVNPLPVVATTPDTMMCIFDTVFLRASGGAVYQWNADPTLANPSSPVTAIFPQSTRRYFVTVTDTNSCVNYDSVLVTVNPLPIVDAGNDTAKCGELGITLTATGGVQYNWFPTTGLTQANTANPIANPDSSTRYYVLVTDSNQCRNVDSVFVRTMYADAGPDVEVCIFDSVQLGASGGVAYAWNNGATLTQTTTPDPFAFPQTTTFYVVAVTDTVGCVDTDTVRVQVNPLPVTSVTNPDAYVCSGGATQLTATGGNTYIWRPDTTLSALNIPNPVGRPLNLTSNLVDSTWYYVTVIDSNGCVNYDSIGIEVRLLPIVFSSNDTFACPGGSVPISAGGGIAYSWSPALGLDNPNIPNPVASPDTTTRYVANVTAVWGCADTTSVLVYTINPQAGSDVTICFKDSVQLLASGGVNYSWSPATGLSNPNIRNPLASPATTTTYVVTITDSVNCVDTDTMTVFVNPLPPAEAGPDDVICIFDSTTLNASGGVQYRWDFSPSLSDLTIANPVANPQVTTTFFVTVIDANGCFERDSVTVLVNPLPPADAGPDVTKCGEPGVQLQASGGILYQWFPPDSLSDTGIANPIASPTDTTTYYVVVTDTNGCVNIDSVTVSTMYASTGPGGTICFGDTLALSAAGGIGYTWVPAQPLDDPASSTPRAFPDTTTTFVVTVLDPSGCTDTASVTVNVLPAPPADAGPDTAICWGFSTPLNASGGVSYLWDTDTTLSALNIPNPVAQPFVTTTYYVTVTGANGCSWRDSVRVTVNPLPVADAGPDQSICLGDTTQLNGAGATFFVWDNGSSLSDDSIANPLAFPTDTTLFALTVTDLNGCQDSDTMTVIVWLLPPADAGRDTAICIFQSTPLQASGGIGYQWDPSPDLSNLAIANPVASPQSTTTFFVTVTDTNGCVNRDSVVVTVNPLPAADAGPDTAICIGESIQLQASGGVQYLWSPAQTLSAANVANPVANPTVTTQYTVEVTDANGCVNTDGMVLTVHLLPIISAGEDQTICQGFAAQLQASGGISYLWRPGASLTDSTDSGPLAFPEVTTTYEVVGTDANGCRNSDEVTVNVIPKPVAEGLAEPDSICKFQLSELAVTGAHRYEWFNGSSATMVTVAPRTTTDFWVIPYDDQGCPGDTVFIRVFVEENLPRAQFSPSVVEGFVPLEVQFFNQSAFATKYRWNFGDDSLSLGPEPIHTYGLPGQYTVTLWVDNEIGCPDSVSYTFIDVWEGSIYFPNAFSPNADGYNDEFYIPNGGYKTFEIQIFDRWGQLVFASSNPDFRWDGKKDGRALPEGVYVFRVAATTYDDRSFERGGSVTLIR